MALYQMMHEQIAVITLAIGAMHVLNQAQRTFIFEALLAAEQDQQVQAVVLIGDQQVFSVGGDLEEFAEGCAFAYPHLCDDILYLIEHYQKPIVAALAGFALGGGLELALACDARVAEQGCLIGLPESKLGLIPGGQGTQRIVRAIGLEAGLSMMLSGQIEAIDHYADTALVQQLVTQDLQSNAVDFALALAQGKQQSQKLSSMTLDRISSEPILAFAQLQLQAYPHFNPALAQIIASVKVGLEKGFVTGCAFEAVAFAQLLDSAPSKALRHLFFAEKHAQKIRSVQKLKNEISKVVVIGAGFMGKGIANCLHQCGLEVQLYDLNQTAALKAVEHIQHKSKHPDTIAVLQTLDDIQDVDLVIEAVSENFEIKRQIFQQLGEICHENIMLASNTSSLDLNALAMHVKHPERVLGLHFFGPVEQMKLLEVVQTRFSAEQVLIQAKHFAKKIKKIAVISQVGMGFIGNRIFNAYLLQALNLVQQGISPEKIDHAMRQWGMKMGPFQVMDLIGNDLLLHAWTENYQDKSMELLKNLVAHQHFGQKNQHGWYVYAGKNVHFDANTLQDRLGVQFNTTLLDEEISQRLILSLYVEGLHVLDDGIAASKADIDLTFVHGYGFPAICGGPMHYIEQHYSTALIHRQVSHYALQQFDSFWKNAQQKYALEKIA